MRYISKESVVLEEGEERPDDDVMTIQSDVLTGRHRHQNDDDGARSFFSRVKSTKSKHEEIKEESKEEEDPRNSAN